MFTATLQDPNQASVQVPSTQPHSSTILVDCIKGGTIIQPEATHSTLHNTTPRPTLQDPNHRDLRSQGPSGPWPQRSWPALGRGLVDMWM